MIFNIEIQKTLFSLTKNETGEIKVVKLEFNALALSEKNSKRITLPDFCNSN